MVRPVRPKPAASLVITKQKKNDLYVLMGQRPKNSRFAPNVWVFPGGRVEKSDMLNKSIKLSKKNLDDLSKLKSTKTLSIGLISAAIRETEEETNLKLIDKNLINGCANITGGGLPDNIKRVIPNNLCAEIELEKIKTLKIFKWLKSKNISDQEMLKTFNCGIGMVLIIDKKDLKKLISVTTKLKYKPKIIGCIGEKNSNKAIVYEKN